MFPMVIVLLYHKFMDGARGFGKISQELGCFLKFVAKDYVFYKNFPISYCILKQTVI